MRGELYSWVRSSPVTVDLVVGDVDRRRRQVALQAAISARICTRSLASRLDSGSSTKNAFA